MRYAVVFWTVASMCVWKAMENGGAAWILCWPGLSFAIAGAAYAGAGPRVFGKQGNGTLDIRNATLLLPYLLYTWVLWHLWRLFSRDPPFHELGRGITIGRRLLPGELPRGVGMVFDLTSEFQEPAQVRSRTAYRCLPTLDGRAPNVHALRFAALEIIGQGNGVYIHCANGRGRTGTLAAAVLMLSGQADRAEDAIAFIRARRPSVALKGEQVEVLRELAALRDAAAKQLRSSWDVVDPSSEDPVVRFTFSGVHDYTHGNQMRAYMTSALVNTRAAGIVIDLLEYQYQFGNDLVVLFWSPPAGRSRLRPRCIIARGETRASLESLLHAGNIHGLGVRFASSLEEALPSLTAAIAAAALEQAEAGDAETPSADGRGVPGTVDAGDYFEDFLGPAAFWIVLAASLAGVCFETSSILAWIPIAVVSIVGGGHIAVNWAILISRGKGKHHSMIPFMGGVLLAIALARFPLHAVRSWWWAPLILDPTCLPMLAVFLWNLVTPDEKP